MKVKRKILQIIKKYNNGEGLFIIAHNMRELKIIVVGGKHFKTWNVRNLTNIGL